MHSKLSLAPRSGRRRPKFQFLESAIGPCAFATRRVAKYLRHSRRVAQCQAQSHCLVLADPT